MGGEYNIIPLAFFSRLTPDLYGHGTTDILK